MSALRRTFVYTAVVLLCLALLGGGYALVKLPYPSCEGWSDYGVALCRAGVCSRGFYVARADERSCSVFPAVSSLSAFELAFYPEILKFLTKRDASGLFLIEHKRECLAKVLASGKSFDQLVFELQLPVEGSGEPGTGTNDDCGYFVRQPASEWLLAEYYLHYAVLRAAELKSVFAGYADAAIGAGSRCLDIQTCDRPHLAARNPEGAAGGKLSLLGEQMPDGQGWPRYSQM